ncbi:MAG: redox-sensing transcriptional repressor Rex [Phycisphaeraceae bacterium]
MPRTPLDVPDPAVRRLSLYLRQLESLEYEQVPTVSSRRLAESLGLTDAQVRKDLGYFGQFGRPGVGYEVAALIHRLRKILGTDRISNTLMVGIGNIGRAVAAYHGFRDKGFELIALFDRDERKVGKKVGRLTVQSLEEMDAVIAEHNIRLAILAVPVAAAQEVADLLIERGIRGILNFAPVQLRVPENVTVRHIDVAAELEQLVFLTSLR